MTVEDHESLKVDEEVTGVHKVEEGYIKENKEIKDITKNIRSKIVIDETVLKKYQKISDLSGKTICRRHTITNQNEIKPGRKVLVNNLTKFKNKVTFTISTKWTIYSEQSFTK